MANKIFFKVLAIFVLSMFVFPIALADGGIWNRKWDPVPENQQQAAIVYKDGVERMLLSVVPGNPEQDKVWIFPIPSKPDSVAIDVVTQFPNFYGENVEKSAVRTIDAAATVIRLTQLYTIPLYWLASFGGRSFAAETMSIGKAGGAEESYSGVVIHEHIDKEGMTTELVTAEKGEALYSYLQKNGLTVGPKSMAMFDSYINKDYSFVVSWIARYKEYDPETGAWDRPDLAPMVGLQASFPTPKIYFPMIPTSMYGSETIPISIFVTGHVNPQLPGMVKPYAKTQYFLTDYFSPPYELKDTLFAGIDTDKMEYTRLDISAPSKYFTDDIWFSNTAPAKIYYASFVTKHPFIFGVLMLILVSMIASFSAGLISFKRYDKAWLIKYALLGVFGCLTLIGTVIATFVTKTRDVSPKLKKAMKDEKVIALTGDARKIGYVVLFTVFFVIASFVLQWLLKIGLSSGRTFWLT